LTSFIAMLVSPAAAVARITGYLAGGVQGFVVAGLLVSRFGGASFRFNTISPDAVTPGVVVAASLGAALFAGLYPFVPWGYRSEEAGERESLRGLLTMPAGFGATLVLCRILGVTRIDLATLGLPAIISPALIALVVLAGGGLAAVADAFWMPPHRSYITAMASSTVIVAGALTLAVGALDAPDLITVVLAVVAVAVLVGLELAHAGRRLSIAAVPSDLDVSASIASFLGTIMVMLALSLPLLDAMSEAFGRPNARRLDDFVTLVPVVAVVATLLVVAARTVRVFLP